MSPRRLLIKSVTVDSRFLDHFATSRWRGFGLGIRRFTTHVHSFLEGCLKTIRKSNSSCIIAFVGLYNPFGKDITPDKIDFLNSWNYNTEQLITTDENTLFIPTYDLFKYNLDKYLTIDKFHPNSTGYKAISKRLLEALTTLIN